MPIPTKHKDVTFVVEQPNGRERSFDRFNEAAGYAVVLAASDGRTHNVDVLIYSAAGAKWWGGAEAVEQYREDPDASISDRIKVKAEATGRIA